MHARSDVIRTVEAAYAVHRTEVEWLEEICREAQAWQDCGCGTMAWSFSIRPGQTWIGAPVVVEGRTEFSDLPSRFMAAVGNSGTRSAYSTGPCSTGVRAFGTEAFARLSPPDIADFLATLGVSPDGLGVMLGAPAKHVVDVDPRVRYRAERVAAHLANAYRLRVRVQEGRLPGADPEAAEAVLSPDGRLLHAATPQTKDRAVGARLRAAVQAVDRARGTQRRVAPEEALNAWRALTSGRWSLIDHFESDGRRYIIALANPPDTTDPRALTDRERQVAAYAALGHSGKQIAYALGIDRSGVSRHLRAAVAKLGLASPLELPAYFARLLHQGAADSAPDPEAP